MMLAALITRTRREAPGAHLMNPRHEAIGLFKTHPLHEPA